MLPARGHGNAHRISGRYRRRIRRHRLSSPISRARSGSSTTKGKIQRYAGGNDTNGTNESDDRPALNASIAPIGIALDAANNLYLAERSETACARSTRSRKSSRRSPEPDADGFSPDGTPAKQAKISGPTDVAVDRQGNVFFSDADNGIIRRIDAATGNISTWAGGGNPPTGNGDGGTATNAVITPKFDGHRSEER